MFGQLYCHINQVKLGFHNYKSWGYTPYVHLTCVTRWIRKNSSCFPIAPYAHVQNSCLVNHFGASFKSSLDPTFTNHGDILLMCTLHVFLVGLKYHPNVLIATNLTGIWTQMGKGRKVCLLSCNTTCSCAHGHTHIYNFQPQGLA